MDPVSGELHAVSLLGINRLMKCLVMLPVSQHLVAKVLCNVVLFTTVGVSAHWRFNFEFDFSYDFRNDSFSRVLDNTNVVVLITAHVLIVMELVWLKSGEEINSQLEAIHREMKVLLDIEVNLQRVRAYCNAIYVSLFIRCLLFLLVTAYNNRALAYYALYSEIVVLVRFSQFTLYCAVILALYQELTPAGLSVVAELERSLFELGSVRRLALEKLVKLQRVHGLLWRAIRCLEHNFQRCLIILLMKFFQDTSALPYWIYLSQDLSTQYC